MGEYERIWILFVEQMIDNRLSAGETTMHVIKDRIVDHVNHCVTFAIEYLGNRQR